MFELFFKTKLSEKLKVIFDQSMFGLSK